VFQRVNDAIKFQSHGVIAHDSAHGRWSNR
jgi:hypothetical protein